MRNATNMHSVTLSNLTDESGPKVPDSSFQKMDQAAFQLYLNAHVEWVKTVHSLDQTLHDIAVKKRFLEKYTEDLRMEINTAIPPCRTIPVDGYQQTELNPAPLTLQVELKRKEKHNPVLSTKPHEGEKRDKKKKLRDARAKAQSEVLQARIDLVSETKAADVKQHLSALKKVRELAPLHKLEEKAATSAAKRAKAIQFGSPDLVANVDAEGWKVVTRKVGNNNVDVATVRDSDKSGVTKSRIVTVDPAIRSINRIVANATRLPTQTGAA